MERRASRKQSGKFVTKPLLGVTISTMLFALRTPVEAQQARKIPQVGFLIASSASSQTPRLEAFKRGLRELGYVDGQNIVIETRSGEGSPERLPVVTAELVRLKVDVIVSGVRHQLARPNKRRKPYLLS